MKKRMRKVMALFVVVAMLFNLCPLSATADVRRNNIPASLGNANIQSSNDDKGDKSAANQGAADAQAKNENKAASDAQAKSENKDTTDTKTKIDKEEDASDSTQIQADTSASEKTEETTAAEKAADNKEASTEAVTDNTEASSTEVINDSEASTTETAVTNDEGKAQSEKDDDKAETKDEKSDKKDDEDKEEKMPAFSETKSIDGVKITVSADKDVFPEGVTLSIRKVSKADGRNVDKAIDKIREDGVNVAAAYTFDIKIVDKGGNEIQPADGKKVRVSFEAEEVGNDNLAADIYHITGKGKKLSAEMLDSAEHDDKVTASTGGFSLYTVEFTYDEIQYVMEGDTSVALTDILDEVGLIGEVSEVEVSDDSLFSAKKKDGEWMVTANKAFSSTEWMKVTIGGVVYEIVVTDDYNNWIGDFSKMVTFAGERDWYLISCDDTTATLWYYNGTKDYFASYGDDFNEVIGDVVEKFKSDFKEKCNNAGIDTIDDVVAGGITNGVCLMSKSEAENVDASVKEVWSDTNVKFWLKPEGDKCVFISNGEVVEKSSSEMEGWQYTVNPIVKLNLDKISFDKNEGIITPKDDVTEVKLSDIKTGGLTLKVGETVEVDAENENYPSWLPYPTTDSCFSMYSDRAKSNEINTPTNTRYIYIFGTKTGSGQAIYNYSGDRFNVTVNANDSDSIKPDASFTATGSDSGILSNVEGGMQYSLDKGSSWVTIEDGKNSVDIDTGISSENGIKVFKPSSTITNPSDDIEGNQTQGISVTKGTTPTLTSVDPTSVGGKGKVTIPSDGYQQSSDNSTWTDVGSGDIELDAGTYYFRTKPEGTVLASELQTIVIKSKVSYEVTFKVVNGSWNDDATDDKTVTLEGFEGDELKLASTQIPEVGSKPNETYKAGSWDTTPSTDTAITADAAYTYTYVKKTSITPTVSIADWTYGGTASTPSVNGNTGNGEVAYTYANKGTTEFSESVPSNAGEYTVKAVVAETDNYLGGEATADFTITKAEVTAPTITDKHYTGEAQTADVETSNLYTVTTNAGGTDAASYDVVLTLNDTTNYKWTDSEDTAKTLKFNIIAANANNVTVSIAGWTFGEAAKTPTVTADFGAGTAAYTYSSSENGEYSADAPTDAGTWYVKASIPETENYPAGEAKTSFTITKAEVTAPTITDKHYTGEAQTADVAASALYTVTANAGGTDAASYDVVLTLNDTTNYKWTDSEDAAKTLKFNIIAATANNVTVSIAGWTYGEAAKTPTSTADFGADTATYTYSSSENGEYSAAVPTDAGTWYVKASIPETENYPAGESKTSFTITKAEVTAPTITDKHYTGEAQTADVEASNLYTVTTNNGGTKVGSYDVVLTLKDTTNYKWTDSEAATKTLIFKIVPKDANIVTVSIEGWTFGEAANTPTSTADFGADTVTYTYSSSENGEYSADAPAEAGTWYVKASIAETDNYPAGEAKTSFVISKAEVTAPAITEKHYTGKAQTADVEASDLYTVTTNDGGTDVGSYDVVLTLKDAVNYKWTDSEDAAKTLTFKIVPEDANIVTVNIEGWTYGEEAKAPKVTADFGADTATYTYSSSENGEYSADVPTDAGTWYVKANIEATDDYSSGEAKNSFVIEPAAITIMADDKSTIYNEELAELTYTIGGSYVEDDDLGITLSTTATKESEPGDYPITVSWKENPNYDAALEDGQYTITKGGVSITVSGYSGKYDGKAHGITVKELEGESGELIGIFDGDSPEATVYYSTKELGKDNYKDDGSKELLTFTDAGKYTVYYYVQCKGYTIDPISGSKTVEITKVPLKVTAKDATITYGDKPDNNGVEYSGFVNDETKKVLKGTLSYNIDYEQYGDVGSSYSITPKGVTAKNYDITFVSGKLKVDPKKLTFTWDDADKTYNGKKQSVTAKAKTINDDVLTLTYSDNEKKNAGKYTAKITGVEGQKAANYKLSDDESTASYEWEIAKKKMSVTAKDVSVEYDEKEHGIEVKVTDPKSDYTITYGKEKGEYDSGKSPAITKEGSLTVYFKVEADNYITYTGSAKVTVKEKKEGTSSSSVEVKEGTPSVSVNGLDEEAKALQEGESADVNVTMSVEQVAEGSEGGDGITAIRNIAEGRMLTFFDIKVIKDVDSVKTVMDTTTNILEICIPYYHISEEGLAAYRYHGSSATRLTESDSRQDGTYRVDKITKKVYIYTNQFSIYAIGYTVKSSVNEEGDTVYDISGNIRYEDIDGMANLILYRNGEECKRGISAFTGGVGTYQFEELKEGNYSLRITMDAGKDSFTLEIPIGDVSKQVVE